MRVLLVYTNRTRVLVPAPPIGLSYVATAARRAGHEVRFVDLMISRDPLLELREAVTGFQPDVVGFSVRNIDNVVAQRTAWHLDEVQELIATVRAHSRAKIVLGGPAASILGTIALRRLNADFVIVGEGELAFPQLLSALQNGGDFKSVSGLCYGNGDGKTILENPPVRQESFGDSGMQDWIRWRAYERAGGTWAIHTKRGCSLTCLYCNYPVMEGHRLRQRAAADVVDEIERVRKTVGPRTFEFTDSTFNVPESHAVAICEEVIRRGLRVNLSAVGVNPLTASEKLFGLMKRAGFCSLVITPDSASETMLRNLRKGFDVAKVRRTAELARASGIRCTWFFLLGGPGETCATVEETVSFIEENLNWKKFLTVIMTGIRILPGTDLARLAAEQNVIAADQDLCEPAFYFSREVDEQWVLDRINRAITRCPTIVHGAEENSSGYERAFDRMLYWIGAAPPYYRFLPAFLRLPPLPSLRARHNGVRAGCRAQRG
jgi:radical SAM superfamily enzyme YgiQ (UPF0313 family)